MDLPIIIVNGRTWNPNFTYFTGLYGVFEGCAYVETPEGKYALVPPLERDLAKRNVRKGIEIICYHGKKEFFDKLRSIITSKEVGMDLGYVTAKVVEEIRKELGVKIVDITDDLLKRRAIKRECEIEKIRKAVEITKEILEELREEIKEGTKERDLAAKFLYLVRLKGGDEEAFTSIFSSGPNSSYPHYTFGDRVLKRGDVVVIDVGVRYGGYVSDITRTFILGPCNEEIKRYYEEIFNLQQELIDRIREGVTCTEIYTYMESRIKKLGFEVLHSAGHGIGLEVHERPVLSDREKVIRNLAEGMVITVEPGIYKKDYFGIRIEDDVLVRRRGCRVLSEAIPKDIDFAVL